MAVEHHVEPLGGWSTILLVAVNAKLFDGGPEPKNARVNPTLLHQLGDKAAALLRGDSHSLHGGHERGETNVPEVRNQNPIENQG